MGSSSSAKKPVPEIGILNTNVKLHLALFCRMQFVVHAQYTAKPVYNDHPYDKIYYLWFIQ